MGTFFNTLLYFLKKKKEMKKSLIDGGETRAQKFPKKFDMFVSMKCK